MSAHILVENGKMLQIFAKMVGYGTSWIFFPGKQKCSNFSENKIPQNVKYYRELSQHFTYPEPYFRNLLYFREYGETRLRFNPIPDTITKRNIYRSISESRKHRKATKIHRPIYENIGFRKTLQLTGQANFCDEWQDWWFRSFSRVRNRLLHSSHLNFLHRNLTRCSENIFSFWRHNN
jgi:hypothetical protein